MKRNRLGEKTMNTTTDKKSKTPSKMAMMFCNDASEYSTRVPPGVVGLRITDNESDKSHTYSLSDLPSNVIDSLAAVGLKRVMETHIRNHMEEEDAPSIMELAADIFEVMSKGSIYTRGSDGVKTTTSKFDMEFWMEVGKVWFTLQHGKAPTNNDMDKWRTKLLAEEPKSRKEMLSKFKKNSPHFAAAYKRVDAMRASVKASKSNGAGAEELDIF